jgi:hypothetical protein
MAEDNFKTVRMLTSDWLIINTFLWLAEYSDVAPDWITPLYCFQGAWRNGQYHGQGQYQW